MEEKKLNLKPFDIEKAKAGKPVCTRDGHKARIISFDRTGCRPIVALIENIDEEEEDVLCYHLDGSYNCGAIHSDNDLMTIPEKITKWIVVYKTKEGHYVTEMFMNEEYAMLKNECKNVVLVQKLEWEE